MKFKPGERLRAVREARDFSMGKLGEEAGVDKGQISRFESGDRLQMSVEQLAKIVAVLGVSLDWIWFGREGVAFDGAAPPVPKAPAAARDESTEADRSRAETNPGRLPSRGHLVTAKKKKREAV